jgi:DNA-binding NtrC family response regulator
MFEMARVGVPRPESPPSPAQATAARALRGGARILMIDDEPALGEMVCEFLALAGHQAHYCINGEEALTVLGKSEFDLIISDFRMPGLSGAQLFDRILIQAPALARRVVFMTGDTLSAQARQFFDHHEVPCLAKPFLLRTLEHFIAIQLEVLAQPAVTSARSASARPAITGQNSWSVRECASPCGIDENLPI